jgi:hypothetical protein
MDIQWFLHFLQPHLLFFFQFLFTINLANSCEFVFKIIKQNFSTMQAFAVNEIQSEKDFVVAYIQKLKSERQTEQILSSASGFNTTTFLVAVSSTYCPLK